MEANLAIALALFSGFCLAILASNLLFRKAERTGEEKYQALGGILMLVLAVGVCGIFAPVALLKTGRFTASFAPQEPCITVLVGLLMVLLAGIPYVFVLVRRKPPLRKLALSFLGPAAIHFSY